MHKLCCCRQRNEDFHIPNLVIGVKLGLLGNSNIIRQFFKLLLVAFVVVQLFISYSTVHPFHDRLSDVWLWITSHELKFNCIMFKKLLFCHFDTNLLQLYLVYALVSDDLGGLIIQGFPSPFNVTLSSALCEGSLCIMDRHWCCMLIQKGQWALSTEFYQQ